MSALPSTKREACLPGAAADHLSGLLRIEAIDGDFLPERLRASGLVS